MERQFLYSEKVPHPCHGWVCLLTFFQLDLLSKCWVRRRKVQYSNFIKWISAEAAVHPGRCLLYNQTNVVLTHQRRKMMNRSPLNFLRLTLSKFIPLFNFCEETHHVPKLKKISLILFLPLSTYPSLTCLNFNPFLKFSICLKIQSFTS